MIPPAKCCQWVVGEPCGERTEFCSAPVVSLGKSYCWKHYVKAYERGCIPLGRNVEKESDDE
jgi:hypothetical protein